MRAGLMVLWGALLDRMACGRTAPVFTAHLEELRRQDGCCLLKQRSACLVRICTIAVLLH